MKKKLPTIKIVFAVNTLASGTTKMHKMSLEDRSAMYRTYCSAKLVSEAYFKFQQEIEQQFDPERYAAIQEKSKQLGSMNDAEKLEFNKMKSEHQAAVNRCLIDEQNSEKEIVVYPLSPKGFENFIASNENLTIAELDFVNELFKK